MKVSSRKAKGRTLQQSIRTKLLDHFSGQLEEDDIRSTGMGQPGMDLQLSPAAQKLFPFAIECKCQESLSIHSSLEQAEANATEKLKAVVIFKKNRSKTYIVVGLDEFLKLSNNPKEGKLLKESVICKKAFNIWSAITKYDPNALIVFKKDDKSKTYVTLEFEKFLNLLKNAEANKTT